MSEQVLKRMRNHLPLSNGVMASPNFQPTRHGFKSQAVRPAFKNYLFIAANRLTITELLFLCMLFEFEFWSLL
jgi:hypothetical protein